MKKCIFLVLFLFFSHSLLYAALIDGPDNSRHETVGKVPITSNAGSNLVSQQNVEQVIAQRIRGFSTMKDSERKAISLWLGEILYPPAGETYALRDKKLIEDLGDLLIREKDNGIKFWLIEAYQGILQYGSGKYITPYLLQILNDENQALELRVQSAHALYLSDEISVAQNLIIYIKDQNLALRRSIAASLFWLNVKDKNIILPHVMGAIRTENDPETLQYHAGTLKNIKNAEAIPALEEALSMGITNENKSIQYIIEALVALGKNPARDILWKGGEFEKKALGRSLSHVSEIDSVFKKLIMSKKENTALRISAIRIMREEGEEWIAPVRNILERDKDFRKFIFHAVNDADENVIMREEADKLIAISKR